MSLASIVSSPALQAALSNLLILVITVVLTVVGRALVAFVGARTTVSQRRTISDIAHIAVTSAEQLALASSISPDSKKQYAEGIVAHELDQIGLNITPTQIDSAIESAVYETFNQWKSLDTPTAAPATTDAPPAAAGS